MDHNRVVMERLDRCAELGLLRNTSLPQRLQPQNGAEEEPSRPEWEYEEQGCGWNETTIVLLTDGWFQKAYEDADTSGECIFAQSIIASLNANHYAWLFGAAGRESFENFYMQELWQKYRWNIR